MLYSVCKECCTTDSVGASQNEPIQPADVLGCVKRLTMQYVF